MATKKKLLQAAAGAAGGAGGLDVSEVFSTYLYEGNSSTQTITNGIDLDGEGGLVWTKSRTNAYKNQLNDTERGVGYRLASETTDAQDYVANNLTSFNEDGFSIGNNVYHNANGQDYVSWTFRKAPKFFDVVTYTGDGTVATSRSISHNLGCTPGLIILKRLDSATNWEVNALNSAGTYERLRLNLTNATSGTQTGHTSTTFHTITSSMNVSGGTYVAYLFAHNDGDGDFGPTGDQDIIKCGSYTGNSNGEYDDNGTEVNLGFEPQWIMIKSSTWGSGNWQIYDTMRGITARPSSSSRDGDDAVLYPNLSSSEAGTSSFLRVTPTGFKLETDNYGVNASIHDYIYIAIRRGPMAVPESATEVFAIDTAAGTSPTPPTFYSGFPVDFHFYKSSSATGDWNVFDRLRGDAAELNFNATNAESSNAGQFYNQDLMDGVGIYTSAISTAYQWMWKRAPSFCDVVCYTGNVSTNQSVAHNLGAVPEMMWVKVIETTGDWNVYHKDIGSDKALYLNTTAAATGSSSSYWGNTTPTDAAFTVGPNSNGNNNKFIAYLFSSLNGVSKVGSYTGNGSLSGPSIDCGFAAGPRFVLIKRTDSAENWYLFDSDRGIVAGADPYLMLNSTAAEINAGDFIDPTSSGFQLATNGSSVNASGGTYIFYAIA